MNRARISQFHVTDLIQVANDQVSSFNRISWICGIRRRRVNLVREKKPWRIMWYSGITWWNSCYGHNIWEAFRLAYWLRCKMEWYLLKRIAILENSINNQQLRKNHILKYRNVNNLNMWIEICNCKSECNSKTYKKHWQSFHFREIKTTP